MRLMSVVVECLFKGLSNTDVNRNSLGHGGSSTASSELQHFKNLRYLDLGKTG